MKTVGITGLGLMGQERLHAIEILQKRKWPVSVVAIHDPYNEKINDMAHKLRASVCSTIEELITHKPDLIIVCVPHDIAPSITIKLLSAGQKVLLEKPSGTSLKQAQEIAKSCQSSSQLFIGQNYRFFPGVSALLTDIMSGNFGKPIGFSLVLGHGGKAEDKDSWKTKKEQVGGGALIDPGIHLIDLCRIAGENLKFIGGTIWQGFWQTGIEEESRLLLSSKNIPAIDMTVSLVRWCSTFRLEFFGDAGYGIVEGRGRSYGLQQYRKGRRWGWEKGKSQTESEELILTSSCTEVFADELESILFSKTIDSVRHACTMTESLENMAILELIRTQLALNK